MYHEPAFSSWIIQTVLLDYQSFSYYSQDLYFEAHIRFVSATLVFKGWVLPGQISGSCYWKTRNSLLHST